MLNTELANTEPLLVGEIQLDSCETLVTLLSTDQYTILFYVYFYLKIPYLISFVGSLPLDPELTALRSHT